MPDLKAEQRTKLESLEKAVKSIESRFAIGGRISLDRPGAVKVKASGASVSFPCPRSTQREHLKPLLEACAPSPFGQGSETKHDESVRKALQLTPDQFDLVGALANPSIVDKILEEVRTLLVPDAASVTARLHKLNVYEEGGFFADHRDTPRSDTHFGTLLLLLPCAHEGGELSIDHLGQTKAFDWAATLRPSAWRCLGRELDDFPQKCVSWAAFFGDTVHRVREVTKGERITLSFELHRDGGLIQTLTLCSCGPRVPVLPSLSSSGTRPSGPRVASWASTAATSTRRSSSRKLTRRSRSPRLGRPQR